MNAYRYFCTVLLFCWIPLTGAFAADEIPLLEPQLRARIDQIVETAMSDTGTPGVSIAIVRDGKTAYLRAYGKARLKPSVVSSTEMSFSIGSNSKQFTATAILMLAEEGKLSLNDPVSKYVPNITRGDEITIRQILSHTSGIRDYWPQDYVPLFMEKEATPDSIVDQFAHKPLDFEPGTQYQYSNTGFVIAGMIIEKISGMPFMNFLKERIFKRLQIESVMSIDRALLTESDPTGYTRFGLGPLRAAPKEGKGWLFAAAELAMTPRDLAKWDIGMIEQKLLKPESYQDMQTEVLLKNGMGAGYALGIVPEKVADHRGLNHGGAVSGFISANIVFPDDRAAIVVLTNFDGADAADQIMRKIAPLLFATDESATEEKLQRAQTILAGLQKGMIDRTLLTENGNAYFSVQALQDFKESLGPLGKPKEFTENLKRARGGMTLRSYDVAFAKKKIQLWVRDLPDGKIEEYQVFSGE